MANPGKNKLEKYARIYVDGYNMSGDARSFSSVGSAYGEVDMTGWSNTSRQWLTDKHLTAGIEGLQAHFNDTASSGSFDLLKDSAAGKEVALLFGGNAEPEFGDPMYMLAAAQMSANSTFDSQAGILNATFRADVVDYNEWPWGHILHPETNISITTTGSTLDNGVASTNGWHAMLHLVDADAGGAWTLKVRHSTDDISYSDLGTFTSTGTAITSEHIGAVGTVNRYVLVEFTKGSGVDLTPVVTFARNIG